MCAVIGMEAFAERARRELAATGEKVRKRSAGTRDQLTPQEEQIARRARDGLTNPEIGAMLFLSPRTVEWHLDTGLSIRRRNRPPRPTSSRPSPRLREFPDAPLRSPMRADITPGGVFPDYELPDHTKTMQRLSELQGDDPLILTLARGHFCPKEHQQHLQLAAFYPQIAVAYTQVATISTDDHHASQEFRASVGAQWPFLSDPERTVQQDLDIQEYTDPEHDPMIPHTLVLKPGLVIHSIYNGYWFWGRPSVEDLRQDLRAVTREIRPDWDLSAPGLREAWEAGDVSSFHGWNKWSPERIAAERERITG
jgi:peroxiredoxin